MPPKNKGGRSDWNECITCKRIISLRDTAKHLSWCSSNACQADTPSDHGYISEGVFYSIVSPLTTHLELKSSLRDSVILLHPSTMKLLGLCIGRPAVVSSSYVKGVWPCTSINPASVAMPSPLQVETGLSIGDVVTIEPLPGPARVATEVFVEMRDGGRDNEEVLEFLKHKLNGCIVTEGTFLTVSYYGQTLRLVIRQAVGSSRNSLVFRVVSPKSENRDSPQGGDNPTSPIAKDLSTHFDQLSLRTPERQTNLDDRVESPGDEPNSPSLDKPKFRTPVVKPPTVKSHNVFHKLQSSTVFKYLDEGRELKCSAKSRAVDYSSIGGLSKQIEAIKEMIELPTKSPDLFNSYGLSLPKGILLYGPSGTGKSLLARAVAAEIDAHVISVSGPELWSKFYGETEAKLRGLFKEARERSPSVVVIDDVDALCPRRDSAHNEVERRVVATLLTLLDGITNTDTDSLCLVLAVTNRPDSLDPALRRPGRLDREIEIGVPTAEQRTQIFRCLLCDVPHCLSEEDIAAVCSTAHGFVGADLAALCKEATLRALRNRCSDSEDAVVLSVADIQHALTVVRPSALREVQIEVPKVTWREIGGQGEVKLKLKQAVEWPLKHPESFTRMGIRPPRGVLMYGPPGCSKTMIAKALATESGLNFIAVKGPELFSKWVGESERAVREVFRKARNAAPSIIFFDEIDALAVERGSSSGGSSVGERVLAQLLTEMDGVEVLQDVTVVAATNRPDMIDKALLRPGRLDRILYVPLPDLETRREILELLAEKMPLSEAVNIKDLAERTNRYSGAEVTAVCHEAAMFALQEDIHSTLIENRHFHLALESVTPRISDHMIHFYETYHHTTGIKSI